MLERVARAYRKVERLEHARTDKAEHISWCHDDDTSLEVRMRFSPADGALLLAALNRSRQDLEKKRPAERTENRDAEGIGDEPHRPTNVDAFRAMCEGPPRRGGPMDREVQRLVDLGASVLRDVTDEAGRFVVLQDPEGNEFCVGQHSSAPVHS